MEPIWENVSDAIFHYAAERPGAPALVDERERLSYADLAVCVGKACGYLRGLGIGPHEPVGVCLTNGIDHLILSLALMRIGAAKFELSPRMERNERAAVVRKFGIGTLFLEPDAAAVAAAEIRWVHARWREELENGAGDWRYDGRDGEPYIVGVTSGSTGVPKGVASTHRQLQLRFRDNLEMFRGRGVHSAEDPAGFLLTETIGFSGFHFRAIYQLLSGGPIIVVPEYNWARDLIRAIGFYGDVVCTMTPQLCRALVASARGPGPLFPRLRALISSGQPMTVSEKLAMRERLTPNFFEAYGTTGFGTISVLLPEEMAGKGETVGRPPTSIEVEVVDRHGDRLPPGTIGRLRCRGPGASSEFYREPHATSELEGFRDGWHYPGDLASLDADGYIRLRGRASDLIVRRGVEIFAQEVIEVLRSHPAVVEAAVVGVADAESGAEAVAVVVARSALGEGDLVRHCQGRLAPEKLPGRFVFASALPRTPNGKLDLVALGRLAVRGTPAISAARA